MPLSAIITGVVIDIAKKQLLEIGKNVAHDFLDSASGKKLGQIINYRKKSGYNNVLLFVHGFSGNSADTFGSTPEMLALNEQFAGWDIFSIGYSSDIFPSIGKGIWSVNPDISKIAFYLNTLLENQFSDYDQIAFVAHSMGGLAVQRAILDSEPAIYKKISHLLLFGTPSAGLKKAFWFRFWNTAIHDLSSDSDFIKKLRADWGARFKEDPDFIFKTIAGSKDEFVPVASSLEPFKKDFQGVIEGNHITMIKPISITDKEHQSYQIILKTLTNQHVVYLSGNPEEINLTLGEYHKIIAKYDLTGKENGLKPNEVAQVPLTNLVFALECTGKGQLALQILQQYPNAMTNSDILGIIGGRHKRKYLVDGTQIDLDKAFEYYTKALTVATEKQDKSQIYYHAINLAFLCIVASNNQAEMLKYAQLALANCNIDSIVLWEIATIAEANLYLGKQEEAEAFYRKASENAAPREKQSIYINAYYGYQALTGSKKKDASFLKMLEELFL